MEQRLYTRWRRRIPAYTRGFEQKYVTIIQYQVLLSLFVITYYKQQSMLCVMVIGKNPRKKSMEKNFPANEIPRKKIPEKKIPKKIYFKSVFNLIPGIIFCFFPFYNWFIMNIVGYKIIIY